MPDWFKKADDGVRWVIRSSVGLALGLGLLGLAFIAMTRRFNLLPEQTAEMMGLGPVLLLVIFMMGCVSVHGISENVRFIACAIAWVRDRLGR